MNDELKKLLGDDLAAQVVAKIGTDKALHLTGKDQKVLVDDGSLIPKYRLEEVTAAKKQLEERVKGMDDDLKVLKKDAAGNAELVGKIEALQTEGKKAAETMRMELDSIRATFVLKEALMNAGVSDPEARDLLAMKFDGVDIEFDANGKIKGFDDLVKPLKESKTLGSLFGKQVITGQQHQTGGTLTPIGELEARLSEAVKAGNTLESISIKRQIAEQQAAPKTT
jgi:hypothetical protein